MRNIWKGTVFLVLILSTCRATNGGSGYSSYGIGELRYFSSARAKGMGGVNLAIFPESEVNRFNPAAWTNLKHTLFSGAFSSEGLWTTDGESSAFFSSGEFGGAMIALPIAPSHGIVLAGGFNRYSSVNYDILSIGSEFGTAFDIRYTGSGGLSNALLGLSYSATSKLHLGIQTQYLFGTIENSSTIDFTSTAFFSSEIRQTTRLRGFQFTFGAIHSGIGSWFGLSNRHQLSLGAVFTTSVDLTSERETSFSFISLDDTSALEEGTAFLPRRFGLGAALTIGGRYLIGSDAFFQNWNSYTEFGSHPDGLRNSLRWSLGVERLPAGQSTSFGDQVAYRLGFTYNATYYRVKNNSLDEVFFTAGVGFPIGPRARANFALEYGFRGTTEDQLQRDNILRFTVTVNLKEVWFFRPPEE